jgi:hypothetical protein
MASSEFYYGFDEFWWTNCEQIPSKAPVSSFFDKVKFAPRCDGNNRCECDSKALGSCGPEKVTVGKDKNGSVPRHDTGNEK